MSLLIISCMGDWARLALQRGLFLGSWCISCTWSLLVWHTTPLWLGISTTLDGCAEETVGSGRVGECPIDLSKGKKGNYLPSDTSERTPPNPSHAGWYSIYLPQYQPDTLQYTGLALRCLQPSSFWGFATPWTSYISTWLCLQNTWMSCPMCIQSIEECCPTMLFSVCLLCEIPMLFIALSASANSLTSFSRYVQNTLTF